MLTYRMCKLMLHHVIKTDRATACMQEIYIDRDVLVWCHVIKPGKTTARLGVYSCCSDLQEMS